MTKQRSRTLPPELWPRTLAAGYASGVFPMPDPEDESRILWFSPDPRGLLPLDERFHVPRRLRRLLRQGRFVCTIDRAFESVMRACADRPEGTWITEDFLAAYARLHKHGLAHSVETWPAETVPPGQTQRPGGSPPRADQPPASGVATTPAECVGGVYGVALGGAFFAESMFHRRRDAGKVALVHLVEHLRRQGFLLCDVQWLTPHLARFGAYEVPRDEYMSMLAGALAAGVSFAEDK